MSEHAELLAEARDYANGLGKTVTECVCASRIHTLVITIEQQDARLAESSKADALTIRALATLVEKQKTIIAETAAACKAGDEVITMFFQGIPHWQRNTWAFLYAAGRLAQRAAKLAEPKGDDPFSVDNIVGPEPSPPAVENARVDAETFDAGVITELREMRKDLEQPEPAPVEVGMRVVPTNSGEYVWLCRLGKVWLRASAFRDGQRPTHTATETVATAWLAALSAQLGVPLEAVWKEGE